MLTSSAKNKGRRCSLETQELLFKYAPDLRPGDIVATSSGVNGRDVMLSPAARELYPFAIECKNTEAINIWQSFEQAKTHAHYEGDVPIVFFKRNRSQLMVCLRAEDFIKAIR